MPDERILLVMGIPTRLLNAEELYPIFGEYGAIQQIRVCNDASARGCVIVVYELCDSAAAAMEKLNNFRLDKDRVLRICVYDEARDRKALERRKRRREIKAEYSRHIDGGSGAAAAGGGSNTNNNSNRNSVKEEDDA